jgi:hypothetical protein
MDVSTHPPIVKKLHYEFDGWLGDAILASFPIFIVTDGAMQALQSIGATGVTFDEVEVTTSNEFRDLYPDQSLHWDALGRMMSELPPMVASLSRSAFMMC